MGRQKKEVILFKKGLDYYNNCDYVNAIKSFDEAISRNERFSKAWIYKGLSLSNLEEYEDAVKCFDNAIEINPRNSWPWNNKGWSLNMLGKYDKAIECLDRALLIAPRNEIAWGNKGDALYSLNRFDDAIECYDKAIEINPKEPWYLVNKGSALIDLNNHKDALLVLNEALTIDPGEENAWYFKGIAFIKENKIREALECYEELNKLNPELAEDLADEGLPNQKKGPEKIVKKKNQMHNEISEHDEMQWLLLTLGSEMGLDVWVAKNDKNKEFKGKHFSDIPNMRAEIPRQFDDKTNRTIELIDVLWLNENAIIAAFEIESTTSIYSGLLRMSDLVSMQPNLQIPLYIVAPDDGSVPNFL